MKKIVLAIFAITIVSANAQNYNMTSPQGYGSNATGGAGGNVVSVSTIASLRTELLGAGAKIIIVTQDLNFGATDMIKGVVTNKTLLGARGVRLVQNNDDGILQLNANSNNVIIRNLIFEGPGAYDMNGNDLLRNVGCNNLWVDHCEFYDGLDGNFDNSNGADNISISWCKFGYAKAARAGGSGGSNDHRFSNLIGGSDTDKPADGHYSITFQCCYWADGTKDRMPRARNAQLHIVNCYYNTNVAGAKAINITAGVSGTACYVENCHFKKVGTVLSNAGGIVNFVNCIGSSVNTGATQPTYTYDIFPVANVEEYITSPYGAGATLNVAPDGTVSTDYVSEVENITGSDVKIIISKDNITVQNLEVSQLLLCDLEGRNIACANGNFIDITNIGKGIYLLKIKTLNNKLVSKKVFIA